jgi:hypothetical protein
MKVGRRKASKAESQRDVETKRKSFPDPLSPLRLYVSL